MTSPHLNSALPFLLACCALSPSAALASDPPAPSHHASPETKTPPNVPKLEKSGCETMPQKTPAQLWEIAECYYKGAQLEKASDVLNEIAKRDPRDVDAYFMGSWLIWSQSQTKNGDLEQKLLAEALELLDRAVEMNPTNWETYVERGDFQFLRLGNVTKAYAEYTRARSLMDGDFARKVLPADVGRKASIEARIGRTAEKLDRKGESVEASCRALFFDPDDQGSQDRIERLHGSCSRKKILDPRSAAEKSASQTPAE